MMYIDKVIGQCRKEGLLTLKQCIALSACVTFTATVIKVNSKLAETFTKEYGTAAEAGMKELVEE